MSDTHNINARGYDVLDNFILVYAVTSINIVVIIMKGGAYSICKYR